MCDVSCIIFGIKNLSKEEVAGKRVLEIGSYDVNGSLRPYVESLYPSEYIGVDIKKGPCVDYICNAEDIVETFGKNSFDIVISNEMLEHVKNWKKVISNIKNVCKTNGIIIITTRSKGFRYHAWPHDYWRYEIEDMNYIFSDFEIMKLEKDTFKPGVFLKVKKNTEYIEKNISDYKLYNIISRKKITNIDNNYKSLYFYYLIYKNEIETLLIKSIWFISSKLE
jgi:2-polyprenyl-3-methyl-5-hydroxy-6-metoxy-1,4-benzoquinol methylase